MSVKYRDYRRWFDKVLGIVYQSAGGGPNNRMLGTRSTISLVTQSHCERSSFLSVDWWPVFAVEIS